MDDRAFTQLVRQHSAAVLRYLRRRTAWQDAEDLTADVFVIAWNKRADIPEGYELAWLYRTAGFVLANHRRKLAPIPLDVGDEQQDATAPGTDELVLEDQGLRAALSVLSERDREVLLLNAWEGLTGDELGSALGLTRSAAAVALSRARKRFTAELQRWEGGRHET